MSKWISKPPKGPRDHAASTQTKTQTSTRKKPKGAPLPASPPLKPIDTFKRASKTIVDDVQKKAAQLGQNILSSDAGRLTKTYLEGVAQQLEVRGKLFERTYALMKPIVDRTGTFDPADFEGKTFEEFREFLIAQAEVDDNKSYRSPFANLIKQHKFRPLLETLYQRSHSEYEVKAPPHYIEKLLREFTAELIDIDSDVFTQVHMSSFGGRSILKDIITGDETNRDTKIDLLEAMRRVGKAKQGEGSEAQKIDARLSWFNINRAVNDFDLREASIAAISLLDSIDATETLLAKSKNDYALKVQEKSKKHDAASRLQRHLAEVVVMVSDDALWKEVKIDSRTARIDAKKVKAAVRLHLLTEAKRLFAQGETVRSEEGLIAYNKDVRRFLAGSILKNIDPESYNAHEDFTTIETPGGEFVTHKNDKGALNEGIVGVLGNTAGDYKKAITDLNNFSEMIAISKTMGARVYIAGPVAIKDETAKETVVDLVNALTETRMKMWLGYKQHSALSRGISQTAGVIDNGDIAEINAANAQLNAISSKLITATNEEEVIAALDQLRDGLERDGVIRNGLVAAEMDGIEGGIQLVQTMAEIAAIALVTRGTGASFAGAEAATTGTAATVEATVAAARTGRVAQLAARIGQTAMRSARAFALGCEMTVVNNAVELASGQASATFDVGAWVKDAFATGLSMALTGFLPVGPGTSQSLIKNLWARYTAGGAKAALRFVRDTGVETIEEALDQQVRNALDGKADALSLAQLKELAAACAVGGGFKVGEVAEAIKGDIKAPAHTASATPTDPTTLTPSVPQAATKGLMEKIKNSVDEWLNTSAIIFVNPATVSTINPIDAIVGGIARLFGFGKSGETKTTDTHVEEGSVTTGALPIELGTPPSRIAATEVLDLSTIPTDLAQIRAFNRTKFNQLIDVAIAFCGKNPGVTSSDATAVWRMDDPFAALERPIPKEEMAAAMARLREVHARYGNGNWDNTNIGFIGTDFSEPIGFQKRKVYISPPFNQLPEFLELLFKNLKAGDIKYIDPKVHTEDLVFNKRGDLISQKQNTVCFYFENDQEFAKFVDIVKQTEQSSGILLLKYPDAVIYGQVHEGKINFGVDANTESFDNWHGSFRRHLIDVYNKGKETGLKGDALRQYVAKEGKTYLEKKLGKGIESYLDSGVNPTSIEDHFSRILINFSQDPKYPEATREQLGKVLFDRQKANNPSNLVDIRRRIRASNGTITAPFKSGASPRDVVAQLALYKILANEEGYEIDRETITLDQAAGQLIIPLTKSTPSEIEERTAAAARAARATRPPPKSSPNLDPRARAQAVIDSLSPTFVEELRKRIRNSDGVVTTTSYSHLGEAEIATRFHAWQILAGEESYTIDFAGIKQDPATGQFTIPLKKNAEVSAHSVVTEVTRPTPPLPDLPPLPDAAPGDGLTGEHGGFPFVQTAGRHIIEGARKLFEHAAHYGKLALMGPVRETAGRIKTSSKKEVEARANEIAHECDIANKPYWSSLNAIGADQLLRVAVAKIAAAQEGEGTSIFIQNYGIVSEAARIEIAKIAAAQNGWGTSYFIQRYEIESEVARIEIAKIAAAQNGGETSEHIQKYEIESEVARIEIAKIAAAQNGGETSICIQNYGIESEIAHIEIAKIAAAQDGMGTSGSFQNYGIKSEAARIEIAILATITSPDYKTLFEIVNRYDLGLPPLPDKGVLGTEDIRAWATSALRKKGLPTTWADALYADMQRRDVGVPLFFQLLAEWHRDPSAVTAIATQGPKALSRFLLKQITGLDLKGLTDRHSARAVADLYEATMGLQSGLSDPVLQSVPLDPSLVAERKLTAVTQVIHSLNRLKGILGSRVVEDWPAVVARHFKTPVTSENARDGVASIDDHFLTLFRERFQIGAVPITLDQITALEGEWGNLDPLYTLVARFHGRSTWNTELPLLASVAVATLNGTFRDAKYNGFTGDAEDGAAATTQTAMLKTPAQRAGWRANYSRTDIYKSGSNATAETSESLFAKSKTILTDQVLGHVGGTVGAVRDRRAVDAIKSALVQKPKTETLQAYKDNPVALTHAVFEFLNEATDFKHYQDRLTLINGNAGLLGLTQQLQSDVHALRDATRHAEKVDEAIVFTTTTDDAKLLLTVGDLVDTSSCQNYRTGSHVQTLLGYVVDANVKAVLSYALKEKDFRTPADYARAKALIASGVKPEFIAAKQQLKIGDMVIDLPKAYRRHVVKLGATPDGNAGIFMERAYAQNHPAEEMMQQQVAAVRDELAKASAAATDTAISMPKSRNPGGVYSDAFGGVASDAYSLTAPPKPVEPAPPVAPPPADAPERHAAHMLGGAALMADASVGLHTVMSQFSDVIAAHPVAAGFAAVAASAAIVGGVALYRSLRGSSTKVNSQDLTPSALTPSPSQERFEEVRAKAEALYQQHGPNIFMVVHTLDLDEPVRIEIAKIAAEQAGWIISEHIQNFGIASEAARIEIAKIAAAQSGRSISEHIQNFGIASEAARIEIAKIAAALHGRGTSEYIQNYGIASEATLIEIAKIAAAQDGRGTSEYIQNYGIASEAARIEIAKIAAAQDGWRTSRYIQNYGIKSEAARIEIAKVAAAQSGLGTTQYIQNFGIASEAARIEIAKIAAAQSGLGTSWHIQNYGIESEAARIEVAKIAAAQHGGGTSEYIQNFGIKSEAARIEIAKIAAENNGRGTSEYIQNYGIKSEAARIEIAKIAAAQDGGGTSVFIQKYGIKSEAARIEVAKIAAAQDGRGTSENIQNYGIKSEAALAEIAVLVTITSPDSKTLSGIVNRYDLGLPPLPDKVALDTEDIRAWATHALIKKGMPATWADALYADMQRRDVGVPLFFQLLAEWHRNPGAVTAVAAQGPKTLSRFLLNQITGLDLKGLTDRHSARAVADLYEATMGLQSGLVDPALKSIPLDPSLVAERKLTAVTQVIHSLNRLKGILGSRVADDWPAVVVRHFKTPVTPENARDVATGIDDHFLALFRERFQIGAVPITVDQITALEGAWGNLDPLYTLAARFHGKSDWRNELPLLGRVAEATLNGTFRDAKYNGFAGDAEDIAAATAQTAMLKTPEQRAGWQANYSRTDIYKSGGSATAETAETLFAKSRAILTDQVLGHVGDAVGAVRDRRAVDAIKLALIQRPKTETLKANKDNPAALTHAVFEFLSEATEFKQYKDRLTLINGNAGILGLTQQLQNDVRTLADATRHAEKVDEAIVFTTTTDDPKLLLTVGDLVDTSSCQNYRTGSHIQTLLGYVVDANVKAVLSYALKEKDFRTPADYAHAKELIASGVKPEFIAARQQLKIGDMVVQLPKAYRRHVVKLGATPDGNAGIFMERAYAQNHPAETEMQQQVAAVRDELANASGAVTDQPISIPKSRNPGGVYSDAFGGAAMGAYSITVVRPEPPLPEN